MILFYCVPTIFSQQPLSRNYILKDGLPSNETYHIISDKKGFLWIATDAGICKFDGYKFKVFGEKDGLPESVVLKLYEDRKGRIWFSTLSSKIGYVLQDKVHLIKNFSVKIENNKVFTPYVYSFYVDKKDALWIGTIATGSLFKLPYPYKKQYIIEKNTNAIIKFDRDKNNIIPFVYCSDKQSFNICVKSLFFYSERYYKSKSKTKQQIIGEKTTSQHKIFALSKNGKVFFSDVKQLFKISNGKLKLIKEFGNNIIWTAFDSKQQLWIGVLNSGVYCFPNIEKHPNKFYFFYDGISVTSVEEDLEGGYWFSTIDKGIFYLPSKKMKAIGTKNDLQGKNINSLALISKNMIFAQERGGDCYLIKRNKIEKIEGEFISVTYNKRFPDKLFLGGSQPMFYNLSTKKNIRLGFLNDMNYYAKTFITDDNGFMYAFYPKVPLRITKSFKFQPLFRTSERINDLFFDTKNKKFWLGTNGGLISYVEGQPITYWKYRHKLLRNRVDKIVEDINGFLWLATRGNGLFIFDKKKNIQIIDESDGLPSNFCRTLHKDSFNNIWVGTNSGLSKIDVNTKKVSNFSFLNELVSGEIYDIKRIENDLWVATGQGVYQFFIPELDRIKLKTPIYITKVGTQFKDTIQPLKQLKYNENFLKFSFIGLSYYNAGKLTYSYKLSPIDTVWRETNDLSVEYFNLPDGDYEFVVKVASVGNNIKSPSAHFKFTILLPFWKTWWFIGIVIGCLMMSISLFLNYKILQVRKKEKEKGKIELLLAKMEAKALRAQMSPHFIFNALNSIQNFILKNENRSAHEYLSKFARLMRNILDGSNAEFITLEKEIETLTLYIQLEKMRASDRFDFEFVIDEKIHVSNMFIPSMILQPFIENAILHGLFPKMDTNGFLKVTFIDETDQIRCIIEDNGIGRNEAKKINEKKQHYHKSMGMSVTHDRIEKLKKINKLNAEYMIYDLLDDKGNSEGTKVILILPVNKNKI